MKVIFREKKGFTLVEMAIVLVIVGLLVGLGSSMIGPLTNMAKLRESREIIDSDMTSVLAWAASNNSLPTVAEFQANTPRINDSWGRPLIYLYDNNLNAPAPANKDTICGRRSTQITLTTIDPAAVINNVAYVIMSQGEDTATVAPAVFTTLDGAAVMASTALVTPPTPRAIVVPASTDDIVRWVTLDELRSKIGCQGAQLKILNNELPPASTTAAYNATLIPDGGVPFATGPNTYKWCVQSAIPPGLIFTPATLNLNCAALAEASWSAANASLVISGTATAPGTYSFTIFARDDNDPAGTNDNITSKAFVLTVNP